jgi:hypothetical protein
MIREHIRRLLVEYRTTFHRYRVPRDFETLDADEEYIRTFLRLPP